VPPAAPKRWSLGTWAEFTDMRRQADAEIDAGFRHYAEDIALVAADAAG
jgi:hypothetical protein